MVSCSLSMRALKESLSVDATDEESEAAIEGDCSACTVAYVVPGIL